jgi:hypothetical protein
MHSVMTSDAGSSADIGCSLGEAWFVLWSPLPHQVNNCDGGVSLGATQRLNSSIEVPNFNAEKI